MARGGLVTDEVEAKKKAGVAAPAAGKSVGAVERKEEEKEAGAKAKKDEKKGGQSEGRKTIELTEKFSCRAKGLWEIVMDENRWKGFTQSDAGISREVGGEIAVFGGSVMGSGVELQEGKLIVQKWRFRSCPDGFASTVKLIFEDPERGVTIVRLTHSDIPEEDRELFYCVDVNKVFQALVKRGNISKMPAIQVWKDGEMKAEVIGGHKAWIVIEEVKRDDKEVPLVTEQGCFKNVIPGGVCIFTPSLNSQ